MQERDTRRTLDLSLGNEQIIKQTKRTGEGILYRGESLSKDTDNVCYVQIM